MFVTGMISICLLVMYISMVVTGQIPGSTIQVYEAIFE